MKRISCFALVLFGFSFLPAKAQYDVRPASQQGAQTDAALFYCLPQNAFRVEISIEKTIRERGIYSDYADQLLKLPSVGEDGTTYEIKEIRIRTLACPDPEQTYRIEGYDLPSLNLSPEGFLTGVNAGIDPDLPKPVPHHPEPERKRPGRLPKTDDRFAPVADLNASKRFDTLVSQHRKDTVTIIEKVLTPRIDEKSLFEQARKMADQILKIQNDQADLLSGLQEVAYPEGTLKFMYRQLERNEKRFLECFTGTVRQEELHYGFDVFPIKGKDTYPIAFFSPEEGIEPIPGESAQDLLSDNDLVYMRLKILPVPFKENPNGKPASTKENKSAPKGFAYRIPARAEVEIRYNGQTMEKKNTFVSQWGEVRQLPVLNGYTILFHQETGALRHIGKLPQGETPSLPAPKKNKR